MVDGNSDPVSMIAQALLTHDSIGHAQIVVDELEGTITLKGIVETEQDKFIAESLAHEHAGMVQVINKLRVSGF